MHFSRDSCTPGFCSCKFGIPHVLCISDFCSRKIIIAALSKKLLFLDIPLNCYNQIVAFYSSPRLAFTFMLALLFTSDMSFALENDKQQPINIESSQAEADYKNGTTTYTGNVLLTQGSLKIQADQLIIYRGDKRVNSIISKGLPARFQQQPFINKPPVYANALTITYDLIKEILLLEGDVFIELDGSTHQGEKYEYNLQNQMLSAVGDSDNRVKVTFDPTVIDPLLDQPETNEELNSEELKKLKNKMFDHLETPSSGQKPEPLEY